MKAVGTIIAILNPELVLVRAIDPTAFFEKQKYRVFEEVELAEAGGPRVAQIPKGMLEYSAAQQEDDIFLLSVSVQRVTDTKMESPLALAASGIAPWMMPQEVSVTKEVSRSAQLSRDQSLGITVGPVKVGDYVCAI
jgi:hypothetical protein